MNENTATGEIKHYFLKTLLSQKTLETAHLQTQILSSGNKINRERKQSSQYHKINNRQTSNALYWFLRKYILNYSDNGIRILEKSPEH